MDEITDPTDLARDMARDAGELETIERDIAKRSVDDPQLPGLVHRAQDAARDLAEDAEDQKRT